MWRGRLHVAFVLTTRAAARLLASADSVSALAPVARAWGFDDDSAPLPRSVLREFALDALVQQACVYGSSGALRLFVARLRESDDLTLDQREHVRRIASALLRYAASPYWCLALVSADARTVTLAAIAPQLRAPRIAALHVHRDRVVDSDADTLRALATISETDAALRHARCLDILSRDAVSSRFIRALEQAIDVLATSLDRAPRTLRAGRARLTPPTPAERQELALLSASRCLFLAFLEAKGWLDGKRDFLLQHALSALERGGSLHDRLLRPLFFGTLNTRRSHRAPAARAFGQVPFLNGGLFTPTPLEQRFRTFRFSDAAITRLIADVLDRHRFTAHEDSTAFSEAAVDPEMLGRAFESLMAPADRRRSGSYYTPPSLVTTTVEAALRDALPPNDAPAEEQRAAILALRVLDPACGSGAFLVHVLEALDTRLQRTGDTRPAHIRRRDILASSIFGVDREPLAVWLCELRLWLSVVIDCPETDCERIPPLPNLDHQIRVGDSLAGGTFTFAPPGHRTLTALRARYARATGPRKQSLAAHLHREERARTLGELDRRQDALRRERADLLTTLRHRDLFGQRTRPTRSARDHLASLRRTARELSTHRTRIARGGALPFRFAALFADVAAANGFGLLIGNPPWVRPHALPATERERLRLEFRAMRFATWRDGAARAGAGTGFATQADLAVAFVERSVDLLRAGGTLALLVPAKLWRTLSGGGIRRLLLTDTTVRTLHDWSDAPSQFEAAATYPSLIVATRNKISGPTSTPTTHNTEHTTTNTYLTTNDTLTITRHLPKHTTTHNTQPTTLSLEPNDPGAPWLLLPPRAHAAFERLRTAGPPLARSAISRPTLGVKCGCNAAFLVQQEDADADTDTARITSLEAPPRTGTIERELLRPALRGETLAAHARDNTTDNATRIIWTHGPDMRALRTLPAHAARWFGPWRPRLNARRDARARQPWWTLFRTEAARNTHPRVVWADLARRLTPIVLPAGDPTVPLNSCYVVHTADLHHAHALAALLHSRIANAWLDAIAEPARGGYRRFLGWTVGSLPIPADWDAAARTLAPLGRHLTLGVETPDLEHIVAQCYGLTMRELEPLLESTASPTTAPTS